MAICKDKMTNYLDKLGYNVVRLPRTGINPLDLIIEQGKKFENLGSLKSVWSSSEPVPTPTVDNKAANISTRETSLLDLNIGLNALSSIFEGLGFSIPSLGTAFTKARKLKLVFNNVRIEKIETFAIGDYLSAADSAKLDQRNIVVKYLLDEELPIYVISETLLSNSITVEAYKDSSTKVDIDLGVLNEAIKVDLKSKFEKSSESAITYEGGEKDYLVFGFKCFEIAYSEEWIVKGPGDKVYLSDPDEVEPIKLKRGRLDIIDTTVQ
jgi:hypothetical protein